MYFFLFLSSRQSLLIFNVLLDTDGSPRPLIFAVAFRSGTSSASEPRKCFFRPREVPLFSQAFSRPRRQLSILLFLPYSSSPPRMASFNVRRILNSSSFSPLEDSFPGQNACIFYARDPLPVPGAVARIQVQAFPNFFFPASLFFFPVLSLNLVPFVYFPFLPLPKVTQCRRRSAMSFLR